jgi:hypothetical protein
LHLSPLVAYLVSQIVVYTCWNFPLNRWCVFPARDPALVPVP